MYAVEHLTLGFPPYSVASPVRGTSITVRLALLVSLIGAFATFAPASASAAACASGTTNWIAGAPDNNFQNDANWDNGSPTAACDAKIEVATAPVILSGIAAVEDLTIGSNQTVKLQNGPVPTLNAVTVHVQENAMLQLGCVVGGVNSDACDNSSDPAAQVNVSSTDPGALANAGTMLIAGAGSDAVRHLFGNVTNTGALQVNNGMWWGSNGPEKGTFTNKGTIAFGPACKAGGGDECMYANSGDSTFVNDAGGLITNSGNVKYFLTEGGYTQGAGNTSTGTNSAVKMRGGKLILTGVASTAEIVIQGNNPTATSGTVGSGQTIKVESTLAAPAGPGTLLNGGTIRIAANGALLTGNITTQGAGLLDIAMNASHSGGTLDATGGSMLIASGTQLFEGTMQNHGGQIVGGGTIIGNVDNVSGNLNPALGIGTMTITGDYAQAAGATLAIEAQGVAGPQHDLLLVGHKVTLDGTLRIVPELGYLSPAEGDALKVIDYNDPRSGEFTKSLAEPAFTSANPVNVGYNDADTSVFAFIGPPAVAPVVPGGKSSPVATLLNSSLYRTILESLAPNGSFTFTKKPIVFPNGQLGLEVDTGGSCRLTAVEKAVGSAQATASISKKAKKKPMGLIKKVTIYANGSGTHIIPLNLTPKAKKLLKKKGKGKRGKASASASSGLKDPLVITCVPIVYPVVNFTDGTKITGIGKAPTGAPPAGQPAIPAGPPTVQPGGVSTTQKPVVPLPKPPTSTPETKAKLFKASGDLDATVGASVSFFSNGKEVTGFDASFRVVCGFPFPNSAPLESVHFDSIPALTVLNGGTVIQGSFEVASQNSSVPPTWITASVQGDNSNGYTVRVYERRAGCEGGTIFNARKSS
jgi:hypothetical protein